MSLFPKRPPCPICGGKITRLLPLKIEEEYICGTCQDKIDIETDQEKNFTMQGFKEYLRYYDQNKLLKDQFVITEKIDFGFWDAKIIFDYQHKLFCMSKKTDKTVFEGKQLKSFAIKEDDALLFEGSAEGIHRYASTVPERAMALAPQASQLEVPEPFQRFHVELQLDHPYWTVINCGMEGPRFNNSYPNVKDYLCAYYRNIEELEKLVHAFKVVAFSDASEQAGKFAEDFR